MSAHRARALALLALTGLLASASPAQPDAEFRSGINLVKIDVQVADGQRSVDNLAPEDFIVLDEGEPRPIEFFAHDAEPLRILILLDVSNSMKRELEQVSAAANKALTRLAPSDEVAVMLFGRTTLVHQDFTTDLKLVREAIDDARYEKRPGASTDINPSVVEAARFLRKASEGKPGRRAIVILTDNQSMSYRVPNEQVMESLFAADAVLMAMVTRDAQRPDKPKPGANPDFTSANVFAWAEESGGEVLRAEKDAGKVFEQVIDRLRTRYSLHYRAPVLESGSGRFHRVEVRLTDSARKVHGKVRVRSRTGYFLSPALAN
jgi:VWFA-related protein